MATPFFDRVSTALDQFDTSLTTFRNQVKGRPADPPRLPAKTLDLLLELSDAAAKATQRLRTSFDIVERTGVDIVDMQVRIQNESTSLAGALKALGDVVERQHFVREAFGPALVELDERAHQVSAAAFPSAVEGLRAVNVKLWDFEPLQWKRYNDVLTNVVTRGKLTPEQQARIQGIADGVRDGFTQVNDLLNALADGTLTDSAAIRARVAGARRTLKDSLKEARRRMTKAHEMFDSVVNASGKIAEQVDGLLSDLRIPCYPPHDQLGALAQSIDKSLYESISGVQRFALLNIAARLQATTAGGQSLLDKGYEIRINRAFPDRIYLDAKKDIITAVGGDPKFASAPAALHRFKEGSFKQTTFRKGNLQFSFASRGDGRVDIDADMDLYRSPTRHLFGEVLVNHLTGSMTSQFAVFDILTDQDDEPIAGFELLTV
jgi:hypothetical protein